MMKNKGQNQRSNKFLKLISMPIKALTKARDLYVRSITGCAARTHYSSAVSVASSAVPKSRRSSSSAASSSRRSSSSFTSGGDDYSDLIRAASVRNLGHSNEIDMFLQEQRRRQRQKSLQGTLPKSCSVGMTRIDEEEEGEGDGSLNRKVFSDIISCPRSRSYAVRVSG